MDWETQLISIYLNVCFFFDQHNPTKGLRTGIYVDLSFTDQEVVTIFIFGIIKFRRNTKEIHTYIDNHLKCWFPDLPQYEGYHHRLAFLEFLLPELCDYLLNQLPDKGKYIENIALTDSMPIMLATGSRAYNASVACSMANVGYCSSKDIYYHGVKLHLIANYNKGTLATPRRIEVTRASVHDIEPAKKLFHELENIKIIADKAYGSKPLKEALKVKKVELHTPVKLTMTKKSLDENEKIYSKIVNSFRQSIEIFFNWLIEKTGIQKASKVRSSRGLRVHVFGRFAAALILLGFSS